MSLTDELRRGYAPAVPYTVPEETRPMPDIVFEVAKRYPNRVALDFLGSQLTYSQLQRRIRQAATVLARAGVREGDRVGITLPNCPQHVIAIYAITLLGAIAVETNPLSPKSELTEELRRADAKVVIVWEKSLDQIDIRQVRPRMVFTVDLTKALPLGSRLLINLPVKPARVRKAQMSMPTPKWTEDFDREVRNASPWRKPCPAKADDVAVLLHTGGTTGTPKAVKLSHRSIGTNTAQAQAWVPTLHEGAEVFYAILPLFHAFGLTVSLVSGLRLGATIVLLPKFDVKMVLETQRRLPCTFFLGVAPMFERILDAPEETATDLSSIRFALSGAMPLPQELADRWEARTGGLVIEGYGMTEGSPVLVGNPLSDKRRAGSLGLPFPSTQIRIADPEDLDSDVGPQEVGELLVKGPQVCQGYWNNEEETAQLFHNGWLRTGDLVRLEDGYIVMADRRKEMIITGGFNVYPSQVEDAVRSMPGVEDVAVVGVPEGSRGEAVVAALTLEAGATVTLEDVRRWAEKSLAHYALPRRIVVVSELPRSQIGKVMRRRVKEYLLDTSEKLQESRGELREQLKQTSEAAQVQLRELSDQISEQVEATTAAASQRLRDLQQSWSRVDSSATREGAGKPTTGQNEAAASAPNDSEDSAALTWQPEDAEDPQQTDSQ
ncbi:MAG: AMP-binding protein [Actinomycetaceae bacterium]|nr:AMP-binding protein [Actinomycetaceae bacterium]